MLKADKDYMINLRRELHMYPETDFDLPRTTALIKRELDALGIPYTEEYGKGSVVAYINGESKGFCIGIRADTDALNMSENVDLPYKSKIDGKMHACGHDAHTAILIGIAKMLKEKEKEFPARVVLIFQPSEEGIISGASVMIKNGVLDKEGIDVILGQHVETSLPVGSVGICPEYAQASSRHFTIEITGKSAHAASAHTGIDALAVAVRLYEAVQLMISREIDVKQNFVCSINKLEAGTSFNITPEKAILKGTIRTFDLNLSKFIIERIEKTAKFLSEETGAKIEVHGPLKSAPLYNNPALSKILMDSAKKVVGEENVYETTCKYSSEDFSLFGLERPAAYFRLGVRNEEKGIVEKIHHSNFMLDEDALEVGCKTMVQFVLDNANGLDMEKIKKSDRR